MDSSESVSQFYTGKSIFITGATGFIGMMLIEKLLTKCPNLNKIYILVREKKHMDMETRLKNIFHNQLFERLKENNPSSLNKVVPIYGDVTEPGGAINSTDKHLLIEEVSVVIHAAATVKFNETLKNAWQVNVQGTKMILELAQKMKRIEVFLHISTAYTYTDTEVIEEILYPAPADIDEIHELSKRDLTEEETKKIIGFRPNTYTFTKALTEHLVAENVVHMPTTIIRPSIVGATASDPLKGWLLHWFGATAMISFAVQGVNRVIYSKYNNILDVIPVDYVANLIIVAGATHNRSRDLKIYNCCSSSCNPLMIGHINDFSVNNGGNGDLFPNLYFFTKQNWLISLITFVLQVVPAYVADFLRRIKGKRPKLQTMSKQQFTGQTSYRGLEEAIDAILRDSDDDTFDLAIIPPDPRVLTDEEEGADEDIVSHNVPGTIEVFTNGVDGGNDDCDGDSSDYEPLASKRYVRLQSIVKKTRTALSYFTGNSWIIKADNTQKLFSMLSTSDKNTFPCNPANIDWNEYLMNYPNGITTFLETKK